MYAVVANRVLMNLHEPCTARCETVEVADPERGEPLRFKLAADGSPLGAVLWCDGTVHPITRAVTVIGRRRGAADVALGGPDVSRRAAVLRVCPHGVTLEDFGAGTWVSINDQRVGASTRVFSRDHILIGRLTVRLGEST